MMQPRCILRCQWLPPHPTGGPNWQRRKRREAPLEAEMAIYPKPEQIQELLKGPPDQPVVMINLLQFKTKADGQNEGKTGQAGEPTGG